MNKFISFLNKIPVSQNKMNLSSDFSISNNESLAFLVAKEFLTSSKTIVVVKENLFSAQEFYNALSPTLKENCNLFCMDEVSKFTSIASSPELEASRLYVLAKCALHEPMVVITHTMALQRLLPKVELFQKCMIPLKENDCFSRRELIQNLLKMGYKNVFQVTQPFEISCRGGVVDVFSIQYQHPLRIEFFDDEIESIRLFDISTQRTFSVLSHCTLMPACEFLIEDMETGILNIQEKLKQQMQRTDANLDLENVILQDLAKIENYQFEEALYRYYAYFNCYGSFVDYCNDALYILCDRKAIISNAEFTAEEMIQNILDMFDKGRTLSDTKLLLSIQEILFKIKTSIEVTLQYHADPILDYEGPTIDRFDGNYKILISFLKDWVDKAYTIYIGLEQEIQFSALASLLAEQQIPFEIYQEDTVFKPAMIYLGHIDFKIGLEMKKNHFVLLGENEIYKKRYEVKGQFAKYKNAITIESVNDLQPGDYVIHEQYGIGIYRGIKNMDMNGFHRDCMKIEYKNNALLYVSLENFDRVKKYVSKEGAVPKIHSLNGKEWENTKKKVNERIRDIAQKLITLYALRSQKDGFAFEKDDELMLEFEKDFGYELTPDQKTALMEIKNDMEQPIIMDRLLCGDVGFGKTEIAFRAAFKAILSGKQVALLCPTTLLARQHYLTAIERFKNYGVRIALLSRMVSEKDQKKTLELLKNKQIDFIIGTHRLLSTDVRFSDLGLLIVDEEHKFGVEHKEKIKEFKSVIDVLTLSATPIPRTLQMALTGVRKLSTINTPIDNRLPVQTYVLERNDVAIKEIIERELGRHGQVYYLHNRIEQLPSISRKLQRLVPKAKIAIIHGQMPSEMVDEIMESFILGETNLLLCTTVIENGIDIPNVNTLIVENADCFGLSQLYQLRGRVGRSDRLAYAYLFYSENKQLSEIAQKRLNTIKEFTTLGSGYKIAMRDLLTRGAGDLLGAEQSGFIERVGIDMYIKMLHDAIEEEKNGNVGVIEQNKNEKLHHKRNNFLNIDAYIPQGFFNNDYEIIDLYQQIEKTDTMEELNQLQNAVIDKVGKLPNTMRLMFEKRKIDLYEIEDVFKRYNDKSDELILYLSDDFQQIKDIGIIIFEITTRISKKIRLISINKRIEVHFPKNDEQWVYELSEFIQELLQIKKKYQKGE